MRRRPVRCTLTAALALHLATVTAASAEAEYLGSYTWISPDPRFGGVSGLDVDPDGRGFRVVLDTGFTIAGHFERDARGRVIRVETGPIEVLRDAEGRPLADEWRDAEGLAVAPDGSFYVGFERRDRIARYRSADAPGEVMTDGLDLSWAVFNKSIEGVALDGRGRLFAVTESPKPGTGSHPVMKFEGGQWSTPFSIPAEGTWRAVSADFGPDGMLYILERDYWGLIGFRSRVLRIDPDSEGTARYDVVLQTPTGRHDNLEGMAVWTDAKGRMRLTMVSDDNRNVFQKTEIADYAIPE